MFTGIVEEIGKVGSIIRQSKSIKLTINAKKILSDIKIGDSIATNGICLTVISFNDDSFSADVMPETMSKTNFNTLKINDKVNLERAIQLNGRLGGHIVSGHIDGIGSIIKMYHDDTAIRISVATSYDILNLIVKKGSIAIDGISLTVTEVNDENFSVSIIEHTQDETTLTSKKIGDTVNLENDIIGKYIRHFVKTDEKSQENGLTLDFLNENGF